MCIWTVPNRAAPDKEGKPMPELPDVETFRRYFNSTSLRQQIRKARVLETRLLENVSRKTLERELEHGEFTATRRHGKYLFAEFHEDAWLMLHFGMTGYLAYLEKKQEKPRHTRLLITFTNENHLAYVNQRKLGKIAFVKNIHDFLEENSLGPDPLAPDFDYAAFKQAIEGRSGKIKSVLMNQKVIAGIGNVYSDEILFQARLDPRVGIQELDEKALKKLYKKLKDVLEKVVDYKADPENMPNSYLLPHRSAGARCPRDRHKLEKIKVGGRTAYYCPHHQSRP
jgi:formamidopyrimidine-DNA glycosylase